MMTNFIESNEFYLRVISFFFVFLLIAFAEYFYPRRNLCVNKAQRWINNIGLMLINTLLIRAIFPLAAVGVALWCARENIGLLYYFSLPAWFDVIFSIIVLDGMIWYQHYLFHHIPLLWRLHIVHHSDLDLDISTGVRFHSFEILLSMIIKTMIIVLLGAPVIAVILFEIILSSMALFNHSNVALSRKIDTYLRWIIVTPDLHRVHHSSNLKETNSNFAFNFSFWDRLFNTYCAQPEKGHNAMEIGVLGFRKRRQNIGLFDLLRFPFIYRQ